MMDGHTIIMCPPRSVSAQMVQFQLLLSTLIAFINIPGSVHDSQITGYGGINNKHESMYLRDGAKCTVDSAFENVNSEFLIKSSQELIHIENVAE